MTLRAAPDTLCALGDVGGSAVRAPRNFGYLRFHHPEALEAATGLADVDREIGLEGSVGVQFRPFLNNNLFVTIGASALLPGEGYRDLFGDGGPVFHSFFEVTAVF